MPFYIQVRLKSKRGGGINPFLYINTEGMQFAFEHYYNREYRNSYKLSQFATFFLDP